MITSRAVSSSAVPNDNNKTAGKCLFSSLEDCEKLHFDALRNLPQPVIAERLVFEEFLSQFLVIFLDTFGQYVPKAFFTIDENGNPSPLRPINPVRSEIEAKTKWNLLKTDFRRCCTEFVVKVQDSASSRSRTSLQSNPDKDKEPSSLRPSLCTPDSEMTSQLIADSQLSFTPMTANISKPTLSLVLMDPSPPTNRVVSGFEA